MPRTLHGWCVMLAFISVWVLVGCEPMLHR